MSDYNNATNYFSETPVKKKKNRPVKNENKSVTKKERLDRKIFLNILVAIYMVVSLIGFIYLFVRVEESHLESLAAIKKLERADWTSITGEQDVFAELEKIQERLNALDWTIDDILGYTKETYYEIMP